MAYKAFLVEDEIVTREGIRDNVKWKDHGFEFCGEATDGDMALPILQIVKPDVLITDIKMPFMDGLQLSKIVRERMPWIKIIILSGHDEFEYAQEAIKLGVTEYLLKPVTVRDVHKVLEQVAALLDQERMEKEHLRKMQEQIEENQVTLRERLLLKLVVGAVSSTEAIEKGHLLGLDLIARYYMVVILRTGLRQQAKKFDYEEYQQVQQIISSLVENKPDVFLLKKAWDELILIVKGNTLEFLEEERDLLLEMIKREVGSTGYHLTIGVGTPQTRIADIYQSFVEALVGIQYATDQDRVELGQKVDRGELLKVDRSAVENYLRRGTKEGFNEFFDAYIQPLGEDALKSYLIKNYIFVDIVLATVKLVNELNGDIDQVVPELNTIEVILTNIITVGQLREQAYKILVSAVEFRDEQANNQYAKIIYQAKEYIDHHFNDPSLSLNEVAACVNLSPSHFSTVFSQGAYQNFKEYLTEVRMMKAKELLRTTSLSSTDISYQVGYNDPHYFSYVFKKKTGLSPTEFRLQVVSR